MTFAVPLVSRLSGLAATLTNTPLMLDPSDILTKSQTRHLSFARHIAIYLAHVACGMRVTDVARAFERDPATIRYACARIEDARDDLYFDQKLTALEQEARAAALSLNLPCATQYELGGDYGL